MGTNPTITHISAGGTVYRSCDHLIQVALILVAPSMRWQLPKGTIDAQETPEQTALREVREETGLDADLVGELNRIEYWFNAHKGGRRVRFHKFVYFFLMRYRSGDVADHDHEVVEARWFEINDAIQQLAFESEKDIVRKALAQILDLRPEGQPEKADTCLEQVLPHDRPAA
jgi:8-oxo-dGTP pyrophosphatase MutT (NUDIX family)